ncbi:MAG: glycosyltransferase [Deltaproteobacteria bacterium]|nr:glycosyltransferase [Deltaproteobacteria bacterium]
MHSHIEKEITSHISILKKVNAGHEGEEHFTHYPTVSVITPSYNQGEFLERTILSVLNQDWPNLEYIIIDGGSKDNSREIIERYAEHLTCWVSEPDRGQTDALNKGLKRASGKYVTWIGSDDVLLPGALTKMVAALEEHPFAGIVYGGVAFIDHQDRVKKTLAYPDLSLEKLLYHKHSTLAQPSSLVRREILDLAGGLDESLSYCMDYDLWIRLLTISRCVNLGDTILSGYRLHPESKTVGSYRKMALEKIMVNRKHTGDALNRVIYSHYWYIVEDAARNLKKGIFGAEK